MTNIAVTLICLQPLIDLPFLQKNWQASLLVEDPYLFTENLLRPQKVTESSVGEWGAKAHELPSYPAAQWLRADPLKLHADLRQVYSGGNNYFIFTREELQVLADVLNQHFSMQGLAFFPISEREWYCRVDEKLQIQTFSPLSLTGKPIYEYMPKGPDRLKIGRWLTEIQMLLHNHPINIARRRKNLISLDSLWFWGSGSMSAHRVMNNLSPQPLLLFSDMPWIKSLAKEFTHITIHPQLAFEKILDQNTMVVTDNNEPVFLTKLLTKLQRASKQLSKKSKNFQFSLVMGNTQFFKDKHTSWWRWK